MSIKTGGRFTVEITFTVEGVCSEVPLNLRLRWFMRGDVL